MTIRKETLKATVRGVYDLQKLRIQTGLRIVASIKRKLGQEAGTKETELDADAQKIIKQLRKDFARITDAMVASKANFEGAGLIDSYSEYVLIKQYVSLLESETDQFKSLGKILLDFPIYTDFLKDVKGIGPAMSAVLLSEFDIHKAKYPSSFWKYAGLDVAGDGKGRSKKKEHLIKQKYINKEGEEAERDSITFNPFLKSKLMGVMASCFLRAGDNPYKTIYGDYKNRLENHPTYKEVSKGHRHNMALRYMVKQFLVDLHKEWRRIEGLPVSESYATAKLGLNHDERKQNAA